MKKFVIHPNVLFSHPYPYGILLSDFMYWAENIESCIQWMNKNFTGKYQHTGTLLYIELETDLVMFTLRYS
jgi:hypothetical protein